MITEFFDVGDESFHDRFQKWRTDHQDGIFLNLVTQTRASLHGARCRHLGNGPPYFSSDDGFSSLTTKRKVCGTEEDLRAWASKNGIKVKSCHDCNRDKLISANITNRTRIVKNGAAKGQRSARFWTYRWQFRYWRPDINQEGQPIRLCGGNNFRKRGVSVGDIVYVISLGAGHIYLGGRMTVDKIVSRSEAARLCNNGNLYDAEEWIVDQTTTLLHLHRRLSPILTKRLRFKLKAGPRAPIFISDTELDNQATRGVRELTPESASLLDQIIEVTDHLPRSDELVTVTPRLLGSKPAQEDIGEIRLPEEVPIGSIYTEGSVQQILINRYERDPQARKECIRHWKPKCFLCQFDFVDVYGKVMAGFIHVHHLNLLSNVGANYEVDPIHDLRPLCPNCHAVVHRRDPPYSFDEVREFLKSRKA